MNKLFTFLASAALLGSLSACSSDEPTKGPDTPTPVDPDGTTMYLSIDISDANSIGRAEEGDFSPSTADTREHDVNTANFFFFDADGVYVTQAQVWNGGKEQTDEDNNVEYLGKNVLVLKGLNQAKLPKYLVTILNAPDGIASDMLAGTSTIDDLRKKTLDYDRTYTKEKEDGTKETVRNFVMSTTSFLNGAKFTTGDVEFYNDNRYYANVIPEGYLLNEPIITGTEDTDKPNHINNVKALTVYVERLAAKYSLDLKDNKNEFEVTLTVAGDLNDNDDNVEIGDTKVLVTVSGFGVTCTEKKSFVSKNLDGFVASAIDKWTTWNEEKYHRSYWGKSVNYDDPSAAVLDKSTFYADEKNGLIGNVYSNENTTSAANLTSTSTTADGKNKIVANRVTNIVFTAELTKMDKTPLDLVSYNGVFYNSDNFKNYVLTRVNATAEGGLNYYRQTGKEEYTETETAADGTITTVTKERATYAQVSKEDLKFVQVYSRKSYMKVEYNKVEDLYSFDNSKPAGEKYQRIPSGVQKLNEEFVKIFAGENWAERYNGHTVYTVPVEHLLGKNKGVPYTFTEGEGEYGVVRNHWYNITLNKIATIGKGVFTPNVGEDGTDNTDIIEPDPDPDPSTYGMAANIKILSWKIVKQTVDL